MQISSSDTVITNRSVDAASVGEPFVYTPLELRLQGPPIPATPQELRNFARGLEPPPPPGLLGGGFHAEIAVARALTDAFSGLYLFGPAAEKRRKKDTAVASAKSTAAAQPSSSRESLNDSSVMETSLMPGDVSLMDVSLINSSRMSLS